MARMLGSIESSVDCSQFVNVGPYWERVGRQGLIAQNSPTKLEILSCPLVNAVESLPQVLRMSAGQMRIERRNAKPQGGTYAEPSCCTFMQASYSDFQVTVKLAPSDARTDGTAVSLLPLVPFLVEIDSCTALPKSVIGPEIDESVAESVPPLTPV